MQQAESIQKIPEFSFEKELARDHALSLCLCNLFIFFFHLEPKKREAKKKKKKKNNAWPQVRKERNLFFFWPYFFLWPSWTGIQLKSRKAGTKRRFKMAGEMELWRWVNLLINQTHRKQSFRQQRCLLSVCWYLWYSRIAVLIIRGVT